MDFREAPNSINNLSSSWVKNLWANSKCPKITDMAISSIIEVMDFKSRLTPRSIRLSYVGILNSMEIVL